MNEMTLKYLHGSCNKSCLTSLNSKQRCFYASFSRGHIFNERKADTTASGSSLISFTSESYTKAEENQELQT